MMQRLVIKKESFRKIWLMPNLTTMSSPNKIATKELTQETSSDKHISIGAEFSDKRLDEQVRFLDGHHHPIFSRMPIKNYFACNVCNTHMSGITSLLSHMTGQKHDKALRRMKEEGRGVVANDWSFISSDDEEKEYNGKSLDEFILFSDGQLLPMFSRMSANNFFSCNLCKTFVTGIVSLRSHMRGERHIYALRKMKGTRSDIPNSKQKTMLEETNLGQKGVGDASRDSDEGVCGLAAKESCCNSESKIQKNDELESRNERFEEDADLPKQPDEGVCDIAVKKGYPDSESTIQKNEKVESRFERFEEDVDLPKQPDEGVCDIAVKKGCPDSESTIQKNEKVESRNERFEEGLDLPKQPDEGVCDTAVKKGCPDSESTIQKNEKVESRNERFEEGVDLPKQPDEGVCDIAVKKGCPDSESTIQKNEKVETSVVQRRDETPAQQLEIGIPSAASFPAPMQEPPSIHMAVGLGNSSKKRNEWEENTIPGDKAEDFKAKPVMKVEQPIPQKVAHRRLMAERARNRVLKLVAPCEVTAPPVARTTTHWDQISQRFENVIQLSNGDKPSNPVLDRLGFWKLTSDDETRMAQPQETPISDPSLARVRDVNPGDIASSTEDIKRKRNKGGDDDKRGKTKDDYGRPCATTTKDQSVKNYEMVVHREVAQWAKNGTPKEADTKDEVAVVPGSRKRRWNQDTAGSNKDSSILDLAQSAMKQEACNTEVSVVRDQNRMNNAKQSEAAEAASSQVRVWDVISRYLSPTPGEDNDHGAVQDHSGLRLISDNYSGVESQLSEEKSKNKRSRESEIPSEVRDPVIKMTSKCLDRLSQPLSGQEVSLTSSSDDDLHQSRHTRTKDHKEKRCYDKQSISKRSSEFKIPLKVHPIIPSPSKSFDHVSQPLSSQEVSLTTSSEDESPQSRYSSENYHKGKRHYDEQSENKRSRVSEIPSKVRNPIISPNSKRFNQVSRPHSGQEAFLTSSSYNESPRSRYTSKKDHKGKHYYDEQYKVRKPITVMTSEDLGKNGKKLRKKEKRRQEKELEKEKSKRRARPDQGNQEKHSGPLPTTSSSSYISSQLSQIFDNLLKTRSVKKPENKEKTAPILPMGSNCNDTSFKRRPATFSPGFNRRTVVEEEGKEIKKYSDQARPEHTTLPCQDTLQRIKVKHRESCVTKSSFSYDTSALSTLFDNFIKNQLSGNTEYKEKTQSSHSRTPPSMSLGPDPDVTLFDSRSSKDLKASGVLEETRDKRGLGALLKSSSSQDTRDKLQKSNVKHGESSAIKTSVSYDTLPLNTLIGNFAKNQLSGKTEDKEKSQLSHSKTPPSMFLGPDPDDTLFKSGPVKNLKASGVLEERGEKRSLGAMFKPSSSQGDLESTQNQSRPLSVTSPCSYDSSELSHIFDDLLKNRSYKSLKNKGKPAPSKQGSNCDASGFNSRPSEITTNINLKVSAEEVFEVVESRGFQTRPGLSTLYHINQDNVASLHAKNGELFLAPSSSSYDASASSQLFDSRMLSKSVKNSEDKENTSASLPMDLNNTEILSNCLPAESMKNLNRQTFLEEQSEEKKKRSGNTVMESRAPQEKQDDVASLHAKNGELFLAPSSFSYDASASSQLFDSRMLSKSVKNLEDKENTSASKPLDLNNTEMMSNCLSAESMKNLNRQTFLEEQAEEKKKKNGATVMESAAPQAKQDDVASLHAENGELFLAPSSSSYDASASSQLFDSRMLSKSVKNSEDKENTSASKSLDLNNTEILSNFLSAESMKNLNRQTFLEEQAEEKKKRSGNTVMESSAPQKKQGETVVIDLTADDDDEEIDDDASTVEFEPDEESVLDLVANMADFELYAEPIPGLEWLFDNSEEIADSNSSP
ncbi:uncharacterized protein LOC136027568 isoform X3 [Artemia franciscana]|uniref:uncharacterized protein LOC136027568 isoform X3 n=1 Tax=Artemia franciscana TaxID=6661 RepID=UPI0032DB882E